MYICISQKRDSHKYSLRGPINGPVHGPVHGPIHGSFHGPIQRSHSKVPFMAP